MSSPSASYSRVSLLRLSIRLRSCDFFHVLNYAAGVSNDAISDLRAIAIAISPLCKTLYQCISHYALSFSSSSSCVLPTLSSDVYVTSSSLLFELRATPSVCWSKHNYRVTNYALDNSKSTSSASLSALYTCHQHLNQSTEC